MGSGLLGLAAQTPSVQPETKHPSNAMSLFCGCCDCGCGRGHCWNTTILAPIPCQQPHCRGGRRVWPGRGLPDLGAVRPKPVGPPHGTQRGLGSCRERGHRPGGGHRKNALPNPATTAVPGADVHRMPVPAANRLGPLPFLVRQVETAHRLPPEPAPPRHDDGFQEATTRLPARNSSRTISSCCPWHPERQLLSKDQEFQHFFPWQRRQAPLNRQSPSR